jgi:hypothetical protein
MSQELNSEEKSRPSMNRGFELMLRKRKNVEEEKKPKTFQMKFGKKLSFLKREIDFKFKFHLDFKKKET